VGLFACRSISLVTSAPAFRARPAQQFTVPAWPELTPAIWLLFSALAMLPQCGQLQPSVRYQDIAAGPSHEEGGIPLYHRGRPVGIEIEGGEPVLTRGVTQSPLLLSMASAINQLAGGRPLVPNFPVPRMALGGITQSLAAAQLRGQPVEPFDYNKLARAMERVNLSVGVRDIDAANTRKKLTNGLSDS
jgi:hypothetical protein